MISGTSRARSCVSACALVLAACTRPAAHAHVDESLARDAASRGAPDAAAIAAAPTDEAPGTAWTDPDVVRGLAASCAFDPVMAHDSKGNIGPLACEIEFEQSCVADPCAEEQRETCAGACTATCRACADTCVSQCDACKSGCNDDACRRACAEKCGACRQTCVVARDRCATGDCVRRHAECRERRVKEWILNKCDAVCAPFDRCFNRCTEASPAPLDCAERCERAVPGALTCHPDPQLCQEMQFAPERRTLDPRWKANHCDDVCKPILACMKKECAGKKCEHAFEPFDACVAKVPGASVCNAMSLLLLICQEQADGAE
jgi:hypothetical protein